MEYWDDPMYLKKIGPKPYDITWTNDIYKAKTYDTEKRAIKESLRMTNYIKHCRDHGWDSHGYIDKKTGERKVIKEMIGEIKEIQITILN